MQLLLTVTLLGLFACTACPAHGSTAVTDLRAGGMVEPLGLDEPLPALSWRLEASRRGARQTAYQILVGSEPARATEGRADLWDSGRVEGSATVGVRYAGQALRSDQTVWWRVRIWDEAGQPSAWSPAAQWTAGILRAADWHSGTAWISDGDLQRWIRPHLGYRSAPAVDQNTPKWIQLDLGAAHPLETFRLRALKHTVEENFGFPIRYKLVVANQPDLSDAKVIVDFSDTYPRTWTGLIEHPMGGVKARYVRFTALQLRASGGEARFAASQVEVDSAGRNLATSATLSATDSIEDARWSLSALNDGLGVPDANPRASATLLVRREFQVRPGLRRALLHVTGLGHYTLEVNGRSAGQGRLNPGWTDTARTVLYDTVDLTKFLAQGANALGLALGGGPYNVQDGGNRYTKFVGPYRPPVARAELRLEYANGESEVMVTDGTWKVAYGPTTFAHTFGGEDHDARLEPAGWSRAGFDDSAWRHASAVAGPMGTLRGAAYASPSFGTFEILAPAKVRELVPGRSVVDFGQNTAMMPRLRVRGAAGAVVRMIPSELLKPDGSVNPDSSGRGNCWWQYTLRGDAAGESWEPSFFYRGARYLQVELTPAPGTAVLPKVERLESMVVHSDSPPTGEFACSSDLFNRIHVLIRWAQRSNLAHVITDCPHREKLGWLEQYHLNGPALRYNWDLARLYAKTFNDMADAQRPNGLVPDIAPEYVIFNDGFVDSPEWGSAVILAAWQHYLWTGDDTVLRRNYDVMQRYLAYLGTKATGHIVSHGLGDWYDRGPGDPGYAQLTPIPFTATAIYLEDTQAMARIARLLGRADDAARHEAAARDIAAAFNQKFLNPATGVYATGSQTAQAMPLVLGIVPAAQRPAAIAALGKSVEVAGDGVTAGDVGYRYLLRALADSGRSDLVFAMNHQSEKPGYGYQLAHGATSLTEAWDTDPRSSQNHFMLGQIEEWFFHDLAGIQPDVEAPGFAHVIFRPSLVGNLTWARASHRSAHGEIRSEWRREKDRLVFRLTVPPNTSATFRLPQPVAGEIRESGQPAAKAAGVKVIGQDGRTSGFELASGKYEFAVPTDG